MSPSWASSMQSIPPHPTSRRSILILSSHLRLGLHSGLFPSGFPTKTLYTPLPSPIRATCPTHLILINFITRTILGEQYRSLSSPLCSFLHSPVTSSLLGSNIPLNTLFSNTPSLRSSLNVSDQVSHPYKTAGKIIVLYILIFKLWIANWKTKDIFILLLVSSSSNLAFRYAFFLFLKSLLESSLNIVQIIYIALAWVMYPLHFNLLPLI